MREANPFQLDGNWWNDRLGKLTASRMSAAMNFLKSGKESTERENLRYEIVAERITNTFADKYTTSDMQWGVADVMAKTRARLLQANIPWLEGRTIWDVDRPDDYARLMRERLLVG